MKKNYLANGFFLKRKVLNSTQVEFLKHELSGFENSMKPYGVRDLINQLPAIGDLANSAPILGLAQNVLGEAAVPIRSVFFDKLPGANWNVAWHQDTMISVSQKAEIKGFETWSEKQGILHVEPPVEYLQGILTLRIHLDPTNTSNGVLRVIPQSHQKGRVSSHNIIKTVENSEVVECNAEPGDILLMSPLLFHSSRKSLIPAHRRIIHIEYSAHTLPEPLNWYESVNQSLT